MSDVLEKTSSKSWWRWFWVTIIILLLAYLATFYIASNTDTDTKEGRANYLIQMQKTLKKISPELEKYIANLSEASKEQIKEKIDEEVAKAYQPVYDKGIDNFTDFHYSVKGEYIELFDSAADGSRNYLKMDKKDNFDKLVYKMLFKSVHFDSRLKEAYKNINSFALSEIDKNIDSIHKKVKSDLNVSDAQADFLIEQMFQMGVSEMKERFSNKIGNSFRATGIGGGAIAGALVSKQIAKIFTKKVATKLAVKGASKIAGSAAGAAEGGETGLLCGPGAVFCSSVGAVIGGVVGWFATDGVVAAIDEHYNANDFKDKLRSIIKKQQIETQNQLYSVYTTAIDEVNIQNKEKLETFKDEKNGNNI